MNYGGYQQSAIRFAGGSGEQHQRSRPHAFKLFHQAEAILNEDAPMIADLLLRARASDQAVRKRLAIEQSWIAILSQYMYILAHQES